MKRRPPRSTRTDTLFPYTTLFRSAQSCVEVAVVDEHGTPMPQGETGEVVVRGAPVMAGYWRNEQASAATLRNGWLWTGDMGALDENGRSEEHPSELQSLMHISYAVFCLQKQKRQHHDIYRVQ